MIMMARRVKILSLILVLALVFSDVLSILAPLVIFLSLYYFLGGGKGGGGFMGGEWSV
jgi:hypothetical protein